MAQMEWQREARQALKKAPRLFRGLARRKVEELVQAAGRRVVTLADVEQARAGFTAVSGGRSSKELAEMMPAQNRAGVPMVLLESCRHELAQCPNALIDTATWRQAVEQWLQRDDISERLRRRLSEDKVLYHHKLRIAIAGCPNGCSRPQIADLALVGFARPIFDPALCDACGQCAEACPDQAITVTDCARSDPRLCQGCKTCRDICPQGAVRLSAAGARVLMGGKLGRHPQLARQVAACRRPQKAVALFSRAVEQYLASALPGQRFAAWWNQSGSEQMASARQR